MNKVKTTKQSSKHENKTSNDDDDEDSPSRGKAGRRPSLQKKLDVAFAAARAEKQKLTVG